MLFWLFMLSIVTSHETTGDDTKITVSPGAFFNEVNEAILYDKSIPLIYTQTILKDEMDIFEKKWEIENYCKNK